MAWTTTGNVSVTNNNAIVYGSGTSWSSSNLVRGGDIFKAPDGKDYQVLSVQSNTQLTLASVYLGTTASGQAYALIHTGLLPAELAVDVSDLQSKYLTTVAQLYEWETSAEPTVPLTNPATGITTNVKPIAQMIEDMATPTVTGGTINGAPIGQSVAAVGSFTTLSASGDVELVADGPARISWKNLDSYNNWIECDGVPGNNYMRFGVGNAEMLRLTTGVGAAVTGGLSASSAGSDYNQFQQKIAGVTYLYQGVGTGGEVIINAPAASGQYQWQIGGATKLSLLAAGLAVTGALTTNSIKEDAAGNVGIGVTPSAWISMFKAMEFSAAGSVYTISNEIGLSANSVYLNGTNWTYKATDYASQYRQSNGAHKWFSAPSGTAGQPITFTQDMTLSNGNLLVGATSGTCHTLRKTADDLVLSVENASASTPYGQRIHFSAAAPNNTATYFLLCSDNAASRAQILANGNVQNQNNSYGAISDIKMKENVVDCTPKLDKLLQVRIVNYNLKTEPGHKQLGVIAQELEEIFPGMIEETPDYADVEVSPARIEQKITQRQKVEYREDVRYEIVEVEGKWTKLPIRTTVEVPLFKEFPLFDENGAAVMECVEAAQAEVLGENGEVITPAKDAVWRKATHRVPIMEDVTETVDVPAVIERRATGTVTKSVKYSVFVPMLIKAMQEQQMIINGLESRITALES